MPVSDYAPTPATVGSWLRARTKTASGSEAGTFNPAASPPGGMTRPTAEGVQTLIDDFLPPFTAALGADIPDAPGDDPEAYRKSVARLSSLGVALEVELTYFPEQVNSNRSPYTQLKALYDERYKTMLSILGLDRDYDGVIDSGSGFPSYGGFPTTGIGMEFPW